MVSVESEFLKELYQGWVRRMEAQPEMPLADLRALFEEWGSAALEPEDVTYKSDTVGGVEGIWAYPVKGSRKKVLIYLHGGGFVVGSSASHRKLAGHVARALGASSFILDYRRAPEHPFPAQLEDTLAVYRWLLGNGFEASNIALIGDSAGGNLAVASTIKFLSLNLPAPARVIAFSPWLDMELTGSSLVSNAAMDALVQLPVLESMRGMFLGDLASPSDPLANPLLADLTGFPPLYISAGSVETLLSDSIRLHERARSAGVSVRLSVIEGMQHVFPFLAGRAREADEEIARLAEWYHAL